MLPSLVLAVKGMGQGVGRPMQWELSLDLGNEQILKTL